MPLYNLAVRCNCKPYPCSSCHFHIIGLFLSSVTNCQKLHAHVQPRLFPLPSFSQLPSTVTPFFHVSLLGARIVFTFFLVFQLVSAPDPMTDRWMVELGRTPARARGWTRPGAWTRSGRLAQSKKDVPSNHHEWQI